MIQHEPWAKEAAPRKRRKAPTPTGDCYEAALKYILDRKETEPHLVLVHGEVEGQGPIQGIRYGHAWVEDGDLVIDKSMGRDLRMPAILYYGLGQIHPPTPPYQPNLHKYTVEEAIKKMLQFRHFGPWDLKTSSGL